MARKYTAIERASTEDKKEIFQLTHTIQTRKVSDFEGQVLAPVAWALASEYENIDPDTGETVGEKKVLAIKIDDGTVMGTISGTFIPQFIDMVDMFGDLCEFTVEAGTSKNGRTFIYPMPV